MSINKHSVIRLSRYKNALYRLKHMGFVKVFSDNLADAVGTTPSQVRKDFSIFGLAGNRRGGYQVDDLISRLNDILGKNVPQKVVIAGYGHIGAALMRYAGFEKEGIRVSACFDIDPAKYDRSAKIPVLPLEDMKEHAKASGVKIGVIAVPDIAAQQVLDIMIAAGIKGVLNFAPIRLRAGADVVVNNVNLVSELENVIYFVNTMEKGKEMKNAADAA